MRSALKTDPAELLLEHWTKAQTSIGCFADHRFRQSPHANRAQSLICWLHTYHRTYLHRYRQTSSVHAWWLYPLQCPYLQLLPKMPQAEADALLLHFHRLLHEHATVQKLFALL